jgi:2-hydroxychromene-2-carboxylate isomerase
MDAAAVPYIVDVVSDMACPWCYIGKRRLEAALSLRRDDGPVKVRWHPFQLNPELPLGGMDRRKYLTEKFGGPERIKEAHERIAAVGQEVGIWFDFGRIERQPNTLNAHRLISCAQKRDPATATLLVERLFRAFFVEGVDVGNIGELVRLAGDAAGPLSNELDARFGRGQRAGHCRRPARLVRSVSGACRCSFSTSDWPCPRSAGQSAARRVGAKRRERCRALKVIGALDGERAMPDGIDPPLALVLTSAQRTRRFAAASCGRLLRRLHCSRYALRFADFARQPCVFHEVHRHSRPTDWLRRLLLAPGDLLRDAIYRRLWISIFISSFGGQVTLLALPLTAAVLLHATPTQMGILTAMEVVPFVLFSLPSGVYLDRVRKLPVYIGGEVLLALFVASVPLAWWSGWLSMTWLYVVGFAIGAVYTIAGSAAQIVLTQIVPRERLVEAHARTLSPARRPSG